MAGRPQRRGPMGPGAMGAGEKPKNFKKSIGQLIRYMGNYKFAVLAVIIFAIGSTIFNIAGPKVLARATDTLFDGLVSKIGGTGGIDFDKIGRILLILLGMYILSALFQFIQGFIMTSVSQKMCYNLRKDIAAKMNRMPMKYFDKMTHGEVLSRMTNDVDTLGMSLNQSMTQLVTSVVTVIGVLIMMLTISVKMTLIALLIIPVSGIIVGIVVKKSQKFFHSQQEYLGHVNGQVEEVYSGHNVVKVFNREEAAKNDFDKANDVLYKSAWKSQFLSGIMMPVMQFVGNLGYVAVAVFGAYLATQGSISVGDIQSFIQYVKSFTQPIQQLAQVSSMIQSTAAAAERIFEFLNEEEEEQKALQHADVTIDEAEPSVEFEDVKFGYNEDKIIINDFSAKVKAGQKIAIVGPTGAGKTTIVKLLMRFYELNGGKISIGGHDITTFDRSELRRAFGMVLQDTWLFNGSIMENIRYGRLEATDDEVIQAAKSAHVHHFIETLPGGYNMELNEEASNVSQGQKQLLTIARAMLADNKILILDEATSSVDTRTEIQIQKAMDNLMKGRTSFIIAHRLSTIRDADLILVMKDGDIIEQGNHEQLMAQNGFYEQLYNSQFEKAE